MPHVLLRRPKQKAKTKKYITFLPLANFKRRKVTASQVPELVFNEVRQSEKSSSYLHRKLGCDKSLQYETRLLILFCIQKCACSNGIGNTYCYIA